MNYRILIMMISLIAISLIFGSTDWEYWRDINSIKKMEWFEQNLYIGTENGLAIVDIEDLSFDVFTAIDGFAGTRITQLLRDEDYLWYSSYEGYLGRYNGTEFQIFYDLNRSDYLINDFIILDEKIIAATNTGIVEIEILDNFLVGRIENVISQIGPYPLESNVSRLYMKNDTLWAGMPTGAAKAYIYDDLSEHSSWTDYEAGRAITAFGFFNDDYYFGMDYESGLSSLGILEDDAINPVHDCSRTQRPINQIMVIGDTLWVIGSSSSAGRAPAYYTVDAGTFYWLPTSNGHWSSFCSMGLEQQLYFGLRYTGLGWRNIETDEIDSYRFPTPSGGSFFDFAFNGDDVWLLSKSDAVNHYDGNEWEVFHYLLYEHSDSTIDERMKDFLLTVSTLEFDFNGDVWIGSRGYGLGIYKGDSVWSFLDSDNSMIAGEDGSEFWEYVTDIATDSAGNMWVTQNNPYHGYPILVFDANDLEGDELWKIGTDWSPLPDLNHPTCIDVYKTRAWIGTDEGRVLGIDWHYNLEDTLRYTWYYYDESEITGFRINDIAIDSDQHVWIATNLGLVRIEPEIDAVFPIEFPSNLSTEVRAVELDDWDNIWLGTADGAAVISGFSGELTVFKSKFDPEASDEERSGLFSNNVYNIGINPETQEVWFLTEGGIAVLKREIEEPDQVDEIRVFPNPVNFGIGQRITFAELPANPYLAIYTTNGDPIINYDPSYTDYANRFHWDGRNSAGNDVVPGIYIYMINAEDKVIKGTILVK